MDIKHNKNPVRGDDAGAVDVKRVGERIVMVYESREGTCFAINNDGLATDDKGIFIKMSGSTIDSFGHVTPFLLVDSENKNNRLFVGAAGATSWDRNRIATVAIGDEEFMRLLGVARRKHVTAPANDHGRQTQ